MQSNNNAAPICVWALHWVAGKEVDVKKCPQNVKKCPQIEPRLNGRPDGTRGQKLGIRDTSWHTSTMIVGPTLYVG